MKWLADMHVDVFVQVGHSSQGDARRLAAHASTGADAVAAYAPNYFKPRTADDLIDFLAPIPPARPICRFISTTFRR